MPPPPFPYNDYRPIALTYVPFKCLERILLKHLLLEIEDNLDPYQFSYRKNKSTEDATLLYNSLVVEHLENNNAYVRSVFIDFSSAFNKPDIVINKLRTLNVSPILLFTAPDLGLGRLGSCPGASTKKGLHKSTYFF